MGIKVCAGNDYSCTHTLWIQSRLLLNPGPVEVSEPLRREKERKGSNKWEEREGWEEGKGMRGRKKNLFIYLNVGH